MFSAGTSGKAKFINGLVLLVIVTVGCIVALSLVKIVRDPKNAEGYRNTLGLGHKKV